MGTVPGRKACQLITIPGEPVPFARPRPHFKKPGAFIHPRRYRNWLKDARLQIPCMPIDGPIAAEVVALFPRPRSWTKSVSLRYLWRPSIPDLDNLIKAGLDACNGLAFTDDSNVVRVAGAKLYSNDRRTALLIHVAVAPERISVPWGLSFTPCDCWQEILSPDTLFDHE